jgi:hypothetical protein
MKIEQLLVQHFYIAKKVTLQGIGSFTLSPDFIVPAETDKDIVLPENAVSFQYNPRATEDEALINYIVQQTRKIKPLASADLESYLMLGSQFLNIGKPMKIEGIGMLEKSQTGEYYFSPGEFVNTKVEDATVQLKEKSREDISFANEAKPSSAGNNKKIVTILAAIVVLGAIGFAAWYFLSKKNNTETTAQNTTEQNTATAPVTDTAKKDTSAIISKRPDSVAILQPAVNTGADGAYTFKIVFKETSNKAAAIDKMNIMKLRGHKVIMYTADSVTYKLAEPFTLPLSDTAKIKDSLNKYYYVGKAKVELK